MNKRSVATLIFVIAIVLSVFSFMATQYVEGLSHGRGETVQQTLNGKVELAVLPQDSSASVNVGDAK